MRICCLDLQTIDYQGSSVVSRAASRLQTYLLSLPLTFSLFPALILFSLSSALHIARTPRGLRGLDAELARGSLSSRLVYPVCLCVCVCTRALARVYSLNTPYPTLTCPGRFCCCPFCRRAYLLQLLRPPTPSPPFFLALSILNPPSSFPRLLDPLKNSFSHSLIDKFFISK